MTRKQKLAAYVVGSLALFAVIAVVVHQSGCVSPPPPVSNMVVPTDRRVQLPFKAGERAVFRAFMGNWHMADIEWTVENTEDAGRTLLKATYHAKSAPGAAGWSQFENTVTTLMDPRTLRPLVSTDVSIKPDERKTITLTFDHEAQTAHYHRVEVADGQEDTREKDLPLENGWDVLSGLIYVRTAYQDLLQGEVLGLTMLDGRDYMEVVVTYEGPERIEVDGEERATEKFLFKVREHDDTPGEPPGPWRATTMWASPETWLPLRFDSSFALGTGTSAQLVEYEPGTEPIAVDPEHLAPVTRTSDLPPELQP